LAGFFLSCDIDGGGAMRWKILTQTFYRQNVLCFLPIPVRLKETVVFCFWQIIGGSSALCVKKDKNDRKLTFPSSNRLVKSRNKQLKLI